MLQKYLKYLEVIFIIIILKVNDNWSFYVCFVVD
jgi:hypothetical protein